MKSKNVTQIAKKIGRSKATVSRVMNNCPGVDSAVREEILEILRAESEQAPVGDAVDLNIILPDNPKFFWQNAMKTVSDYPSECSKRVHSYSYNYRGRVLKSYLDQIEQVGARAMIFSGFPDDELRERMERFSDQHLLIQLCDYTRIKNSFFVGSDFYGDGKHLGELLLEQERGNDCHIAVLQRQNSYSGMQRVKGFLDAVSGNARITLIDEPTEVSLYSSYLAREIDKLPTLVTHIFSPSGLTVQTCDAIRKLKGRHIGCIGFENPPRAKEYLENGTIRALAVQDVSAQIRCAMELAERYLKTGVCPDEKFTFIPCDFLTAAPK